jgi:hypothetical protein
MPAEATCPHCQLTLRVPCDYSGKSVKCPQCQQRFIVALPAPAARVAAPVAAPPAPVPTGPLLPRASTSKSSASFENLVISALEEDEEEGADVLEAQLAPSTVKTVSGPSHFWRCPKCQALWEKKSLSTSSLQNSRIKAMVRCETCGAAYDYQAVHNGTYDAVEVAIRCPKCHLELTGPADDLLGQPCPGCGAKLPT